MYQRGRRVDDALKIGAWPGAVRTMRAGTHAGNYIQADDHIRLPQVFVIFARPLPPVLFAWSIHATWPAAWIRWLCNDIEKWIVLSI
jgi:hypothetical protein